MPASRADPLLPPMSDYALAALGAWGLWLVANSVSSILVSMGAAPEDLQIDATTLAAMRMLFSREGLALLIVLEFIFTPFIVRLLLHYGLARIAIYMMAYALVWLAIMMLPLRGYFGMNDILRQMGWLTLFLVWGAWNWWMLAHRPLKRLARETSQAVPSIAGHGPALRE